MGGLLTVDGQGVTNSIPLSERMLSSSILITTDFPKNLTLCVESVGCLKQVVLRGIQVNPACKLCGVG